MPVLPVRESYRITELAPALGVSAKTLTRWLRAEGVRLAPVEPRSGCPVRVSMNALHLLGGAEAIERLCGAEVEFGPVASRVSGMGFGGRRG